MGAIKYGDNNPKAWTDICPNTNEKHKFESVTYGRSYTQYQCTVCKSTTAIDSSD